MLSFKLTASLFICFLLIGCGFSPVYIGNKSNIFNSDFRYIRINLIQDRVGQQLRNELIKRLHPYGRATPVKYNLNATISVSKQGLAIQKSALATRANIVYESTFTLEESISKTILTRGKSRIITSYNILDRVYATKVAEKNAQTRAIIEISQDITNKISVFFKYPKKVKE